MLIIEYEVIKICEELNTMATTKGKRIDPTNSLPSKRLIDLTETKIGRGAIFRIKGKWPHEDIVDLMLFDTSNENHSLGFVVVTGYKAGLQLVQLPNECLYANSKMVCTNWLINNWKEWVYPEC